MGKRAAPKAAARSPSKATRGAAAKSPSKAAARSPSKAKSPSKVAPSKPAHDASFSATTRKRAAPKAAAGSPSKVARGAAARSPSKAAARAPSKPAHDEWGPLSALLAKAEDLTEESRAMLRSMAPHCLATPAENRHAYQKEMLQFLNEVIGGVEAKHRAAIAVIEDKMAESERSTEAARARPTATEAEVSASKTGREAQEAATKSTSDVLSAAKAALAAEQALFDGHAAEVKATQDEHDSYSTVVTELWVPLKAGCFPGSSGWRVRNKLLDKFRPEFEKLNLGVSLNSAVPVALKTKVDDRGAFAKSSIDFAESELHKHIAALAAKAAGSGDEAARRLGAVKAAEAAVASAATFQETAVDDLLASENRLFEAEARHTEAREVVENLACAAAVREAQLSEAQACLAGDLELVWQYVELCTRGRPQPEGEAHDSEVTDWQVAVRPYGVLGTQMATDGQMVSHAASVMDPDMVILDPAGLHHIQASPGGAGGAARVIYEWLGIASDRRFPDDVRAAIPEPLRAKFHAYGEDGERKCIHVVGPNFKRKPCSRQDAVAHLATAYRAALAEFAASGFPSLRLLPVSGGIFSGAFGPELPALTALALQRGFELLSGAEQKMVAAKSLEMCIFMEKELAGFEKAFEDFSMLRRGRALA